MAEGTDGGERSIGHRDLFSTWTAEKRRAWVQRGLGTSTTLHARHLKGSRGIFEPVRPSSRSSRRSGHLLLDAGFGPDAGLGPLLLKPGLQRALVERLPAAEPEGVPIHRARFREVDQVEQALGVVIRASVIGAGEREAPTANRMDILPVFRAIRGRTAVSPHGAAEVLSAFDKNICPVVHGLLAQAVPDPRASLHKHGLISDEERDGGVARACDTAQVVMIELLTFHNHRAAGGTFLQLLELSEDEEVLEHLIRAVAVFGETDAAPRLIELLRHPSPIIRGEAARALAALKAIEAMWDIRDLLVDENPTVRVEAKDAFHLLERVRATPRVLERVNQP